MTLWSYYTILLWHVFYHTFSTICAYSLNFVQVLYVISNQYWEDWGVCLLVTLEPSHWPCASSFMKYGAVDGNWWCYINRSAMMMRFQFIYSVILWVHGWGCGWGWWKFCSSMAFWAARDGRLGWLRMYPMVLPSKVKCRTVSLSDLVLNLAAHCCN